MVSPIQINPRLHQKAHVQRCDWPNCGGACCLYGAWVDRFQADSILEHAELISPWMQPGHGDPHTWFDGQEEPDPHALSGKVWHTNVINDPEHYGGTACIFLREDRICALQAAAEANEIHKWYFKPFYCVLHPLEFDDQGRLTVDDLHLMAREPASCLREGEKEIRLTELFKEELDYLFNNETDSSD